MVIGVSQARLSINRWTGRAKLRLSLSPTFRKHRRKSTDRRSGSRSNATTFRKPPRRASRRAPRARLCRAFWILAAAGAALAAFVGVVSWIHDAQVPAAYGDADTFDGVGAECLLIGSSFLAGWFLRLALLAPVCATPSRRHARRSDEGRHDLRMGCRALSRRRHLRIQRGEWRVGRCDAAPQPFHADASTHSRVQAQREDGARFRGTLRR